MALREPSPLRPIRTLLPAVGLVVVVACVSEPDPREFTMSLTVEEPVVTLGDSAVFVLEAEGSGLIEVIMDFGDGAVEAEDLLLPVEIRRTISHAYEAPGTFEATGSVEDADGSILSDQVTVEVLPNGDDEDEDENGG